MEFGLKNILEIVSQFGLTGLVLLLWWLSDRRYRDLLEAYRMEMTSLISANREDVDAIRGCFKITHRSHTRQAAIVTTAW